MLKLILLLWLFVVAIFRPETAPLNLRAIDLNLLVALDALISERHVTRAADRIGLSQPAMSSALGRLRHIFKDELLVRTANGMQPTPRAQELMLPLSQVLRQIERVLESDSGFDAAQSRRGFTLRLSDLLAFLLLPDLLDRLKLEAPQVALDIVHLSPARTVEALENDEIDLAISMGLEHSSAIMSEILFADRMVCVMRKGHPLARKTLTLETFLAQRHVKASMSPTDLRFVDDVLRKLQLKRDVALNVPHWHVVPHALARTDFIAVMPGRFASAIAGKALVVRDLPFESEPFDWRLYWHRRHDRNKAIAWLRGRVEAVCAPDR
jgi:DNA-binding transcriptional LysR family regulator